MECSLGCDIAVLSRADGRAVPEYVAAGDSATGGRTCFRGHYAAALVSHPRRLTSAWQRNGTVQESRVSEALEEAAAKVAEAARANALAVLVDGRFPCEEIGRVVSSVRKGLGCETVAVYVPATDEGILRGLCTGGGRSASLEALREADTVLAVGDVFSTHPVAASWILDGVRRTRRGKLLAIDSMTGRTMRFASRGYVVRAGGEAAALGAVARCAGGELTGLKQPSASAKDLAETAGLTVKDVEEIAETIRNGTKAVIALSVPPGRVESAAACAVAAAAIQRTGAAQVVALCSCGNAAGALATARQLGAMSFAEWLGKTSSEPPKVVLTIGTDLAGLAPDEITQAVFGNADTVIAAAAMPGPTTARADIVLPLATWFETEGETIGADGERRTLCRLAEPPGGAMSPSALMDELSRRIEGWAAPDEVSGNVGDVALDAVAELEIPDAAEERTEKSFTILARTEHHELNEAATSRQLAWVQLMEEKPFVLVSSADSQALGVRSGDSVRVSSACGDAELMAKLSDAVPSGVLAAPVGLPETRNLFCWKVRSTGVVDVVPTMGRIETVRSAE